MYSVDKLIGSAQENMGNLVGRNNETAQPVTIFGYVANTNQSNLIGYYIEGERYRAFDSSFG